MQITLGNCSPLSKIGGEDPLQMPTWPAQQHRRHYGRSILNPYKAYLLEHWNAGCHTAIQLFQERQSRGIRGAIAVSQPTSAAFARPRHSTPPPGPAADPAGGGRAHHSPLTPRRATWLVLRRTPQRPEAEASSSPSSTRSRPRSLKPSTSPRILRPWCASASPPSSMPGSSDDDQCAGGPAALCHRAPGRLCGRQSRRDAAWSNGPVEAHQPPQMVKRQMFWPRASRSPQSSLRVDTRASSPPASAAHTLTMAT